MTNLLNDIVEFIKANKASIVIAGGWLSHALYPYAVANGGIVGIVKMFFFGAPKQPQPQPIKVPDIPKPVS